MGGIFSSLFGQPRQGSPPPVIPPRVDPPPVQQVAQDEQPERVLVRVEYEARGDPVNNPVERHPPPQEVPEVEPLPSEQDPALGQMAPPQAQVFDRKVDLTQSNPPGVNRRNPQPSKEGFSFFSYTGPPFEPVQNEQAERIAENANRIFTEYFLNPRINIDKKLIAFKKLTGQGDTVPLPACFAAWSTMALKDNFILQQQQEEMFRVELDDSHTVRRIVVNAERDDLDDAVNEIGDKMIELLEACRTFLANHEQVIRSLKDQIVEIQRISRTVKIQELVGKMETLPVEADSQCKQVENLLNDIKAAVSTCSITSYNNKKCTGKLLNL